MTSLELDFLNLHFHPPFWVEALFTTIHLIHYLLSPKLQHQSPYFRLHGTHPFYAHLHTFGCLLCPSSISQERETLCTISEILKCAFLGYPSQQKGYSYYDPHILRINISRNVIFFQHQYFFQNYLDSSTVENMSFLPAFFLILLPYQGLKPGLAYTRRQTPIHLANGPPSPDMDPHHLILRCFKGPLVPFVPQSLWLFLSFIIACYSIFSTYT